MVPEIYSATDRSFCHFGPFFGLENENFDKLKKKTPGDIIVLQMCTINEII